MPNFQTKPRPEPVVDRPSVWNFAEGEKKVLGFSGKLHSGKTTCRNFLMSMAMTYNLGVLQDSYINEEGKIIARKNDEEDAVVDIDNRDPELVRYMDANVWPFMRPFSCADYLKRFVVDVLKVDPTIIYGSQEDKNKLSDITWDRIPGYKGKKTGRLSGREILETIGTDIVRFIVSDGWANALKNNILEYSSLHSIIDDIRFEDEVLAVRSIGGKIIRLTKTTEEAKKNHHISNCVLDSYNDFDYVIKNDDMTMEETFSELIKVLIDWGWFKVIN